LDPDRIVAAFQVPRGAASGGNSVERPRETPK
jgi:hypothetical protein